MLEFLTDDLLKPEYRKPNKPSAYGHCYVAAETLYHIYGKEEGYKPHWARDEEGIVHWWLQNEEGIILDPTASQYYERGMNPPYTKGIKGGFLTKEPSKRCNIVMERMHEAGKL